MSGEGNVRGGMFYSRLLTAHARNRRTDGRTDGPTTNSYLPISLSILHWLAVRRSCGLETGNTDVQVARRLRAVISLRYDAVRCKTAPEASCRLRSSDAITSVIPRTRTRLGDRSFDVARLEQAACFTLRSSDSLCQFRRQLKNVCLLRNRLRRLVILAFKRRI